TRTEPPQQNCRCDADDHEDPRAHQWTLCPTSARVKGNLAGAGELKSDNHDGEDQCQHQWLTKFTPTTFMSVDLVKGGKGCRHRGYRCCHWGHQTKEQEDTSRKFNRWKQDREDFRPLVTSELCLEASKTGRCSKGEECKDSTDDQIDTNDCADNQQAEIEGTSAGIFDNLWLFRNHWWSYCSCRSGRTCWREI